MGYIDEEDVMKLEFSAHNVSLMLRSQDWAVAVLKDLEGKGPLPARTTNPWREQIEELISRDIGHGGASGTH